MLDILILFIEFQHSRHNVHSPFNSLKLAFSCGSDLPPKHVMKREVPVYGARHVSSMKDYAERVSGSQKSKPYKRIEHQEQ